MLKGISGLISPQLLKVLSEMGHGDEIALVDANFSAESTGQRVIRADGIDLVPLLSAVMKLFPLDSYAKENAVFMAVLKGDSYVPVIWNDMEAEIEKDVNCRKAFIERPDFYDRAKKSYAIVQTGEKALYANIILKKGVI